MDRAACKKQKITMLEEPLLDNREYQMSNHNEIATVIQSHIIQSNVNTRISKVHPRRRRRREEEAMGRTHGTFSCWTLSRSVLCICKPYCAGEVDPEQSRIIWISTTSEPEVRLWTYCVSAVVTQQLEVVRTFWDPECCHSHPDRSGRSAGPSGLRESSSGSSLQQVAECYGT
ncbi:hypothetical protein AVEN_17404-1 [Araneus ventricosus]|uniref:Uncharacterized protein n=1 Tax=Araneus ventricosus TaxID=182803 RepID=A0A4Y2H3M4_ARAVE|nr:hypothetical protein AVEN_17404-1 [Araneus ventricosus]